MYKIEFHIRSMVGMPFKCQIVNINKVGKTQTFIVKLMIDISSCLYADIGNFSRVRNAPSNHVIVVRGDH